MAYTQPLGGPGDGTPPSGSPGPSVQAPNALRQYAAVLRRRWRWVALGLVLGLLGGIASTFLQDDVIDPTNYYKATNTLIYTAGTSGDGSDAPSGTAPNLAQTAFLIRSADVVNGIASALTITVSDVNEQVSALARTDVQAIDVTAISTDPDEAVRLADTAAQVLNDYVASDQQQQYNAQRDEVIQQLDALNQQRADIEAQIRFAPENEAILRAQLNSITNQYTLTYTKLQDLAAQGAPTGGYTTLQTATPIQINGRAYEQRLRDNREARGGTVVGSSADSAAGTANETDLGGSTSVSKGTRIAVGAATGLVLGLITAFLIEAWDDRLRRGERVESVTGLTVLVEVPVFSKKMAREGAVAVVDAPRSSAAERYRTLRTSVLFGLRQTGLSLEGLSEGPAPVVMVSSPNPSEGKTTTATNLAASFGDAGLRTLLVDCDYHKPSAGKYVAPLFDLTNPWAPVHTRLPYVSFVAAERRNLTTAEIMTGLIGAIERGREEHDIVVLDTPPMLTMNDAFDLLPHVNTVVVVMRAGQTRVGPAEQLTNMLLRFRADVLGVVLNGCSASEMDERYGYGYGYYTEDAPEPSSNDVREDGWSIDAPAEKQPTTSLLDVLDPPEPAAEAAASFEPPASFPPPPAPQVDTASSNGNGSSAESHPSGFPTPPGG